MNIETKIEELRKEFNSKLDEILKPKFEVGKWYIAKCKNSDAKYLMLLDDANTLYAKAFIVNDTYCSGGIFDEIVRPATQKEVEEALIKEAEKRGFKDGVKFISAVKPNEGDNFTFKYPFDFNIDFNGNGSHLWGSSSGCIFSEGKWAEIVKTKTIDEISYDLSKTFDVLQIKHYLTDNKQYIINTLNNL